MLHQQVRRANFSHCVLCMFVWCVLCAQGITDACGVGWSLCECPFTKIVQQLRRVTKFSNAISIDISSPLAHIPPPE